MSRFTLLPDPRFEVMKESLRERVRTAADAIEPETCLDVFDPTMRSVVDAAVASAGAHEGTVWLGGRGADGSVEALVPVYNNGPRAADFVGKGKFRQPIGKGIISTVFAYEQPFCENDVDKNDRQDRTLDQRLGVRTSAMIAVPLYFAGSARGVISCVQLISGAPGASPTPSGFSVENLRPVQFASEIVTRLLDYWLVGVTVGWATD